MTRVISGAALAALFFAIVWFGSPTVLLVVALLVGVLAFHEYAELMRMLGAKPPRSAALAATLGAIALVSFPVIARETLLALALVLVAAAVMVRLTAERDVAAAPVGAGGTEVVADRRGAVLGVLAGSVAPLYIGLPLGALVAIHAIGGRGAVLLLVATIAISDTAQYYSGRLLGRHALAPRLSPKKTIEGAVGGLIAAPVFLYFAAPALVTAAPAVATALIGLVLVVCGIAGDLFESMLKRAADVKDSSALIPGHGGVLDRIDALLFAAVPFYVYLRWVYTA